MRKLFILICCSAIFLFLVNACDSKEDRGVELGKAFIKKLYNIDTPSVDVNKMGTEQLIKVQNEFSSYLTKDEFKELSSKRLLLVPMEVASELNYSISVQNIAVKEDLDQEKGDPLDFDHSFSLIFTDQKGNKIDEVEIKGQMTIVDTKDGLKIDRYYDGESLMDMLNPVR